MATSDLANAILRISKRAETSDPDRLVDTFVDTGALATLLASKDHQVIFGRRGTGKTHALFYLGGQIHEQGDLYSYIDLRTVGSTGGIYSDPSLPLSERATRLLADTLSAIHDSLINSALSNQGVNLEQVGELLDQFAQAITDVHVIGPVEQTLIHEKKAAETKTSQSSISLTKEKPIFSISDKDKQDSSEKRGMNSTTSGELRHRVHFGAVGTALAKIAASLGKNRIWILIDEWSAVPGDLQPYLADLIRRALLPIRGLTAKIAAIEQRSTFQLSGNGGDYVGIELGADMAADLNLDDLMVFDNDADRATFFFKELLFRHYKSIETEAGVEDGPKTPDTFIQQLFTQRNPFEELVNAAEGVPRDFINILGLSAQRATGSPISTSHVRAAAKAWYQRDKESPVSANQTARDLLVWIQDQVIAHRRARAFLFRSNLRHPLIDSLFDSRVLHLVKRSISAPDQPGVRYDVYKIDYGCYVDLLTTQKAPQGLLQLDDEENSYVEVPPDDYRSIRRAILNIDEFEKISSLKITTKSAGTGTSA